MTATEPTSQCDPRIARSRAAVLDATLELLTTRGVGAVTIDGISRASGVARTTIYRHWSSANEILAEAAATTQEAEPDELTGPPRDVLGAVLRTLVAKLTGERLGCVLPFLVEAGNRDPELMSLQREVVRAKRARATAYLEQLRDEGVLNADADIAVTLDRLVGPIFYRHLVSREPIDDAYIDELVDAVVRDVTAR
ncbi:MAG TPA: TetR/AcrR family transcriptional regulator [Microthrixaceae bacterium]|nr:TetR/AcrR family transcriptional regulator [Microthrixaceae bacterium]